MADTHAVIWWLSGDPRLGTAAKSFFAAARSLGSTVGMSAISLGEMIYLVEKGRIPETAWGAMLAATEAPGSGLTHVAFDVKMAKRMAEIPRVLVPDFPDRAIVATALQLRVPVLSRDRRICDSGLPVIW